MKQPYSMHTRKTAKGTVFYVQFKDDEGAYLPAVNSGKETREEAEAWAKEYMKGNSFQPSATLAKYAKSFYDYHGKFIQEKLLYGRRFSKQHSQNYTRAMTIHFIPHFGDKKALKDVTADDIREWQFWLQAKGLSSQTQNHVYTAAKTIFTWARDRDHLIERNPFDTIPRVRIRSRERGSFTPDEIGKLLALPMKDKRYKTFFTLASLTGLRCSEMQGLKRKFVFPDHLEIRAVWDRVEGYKDTTKSGKVRHIPIPERLYKELQSLMEGAPWDSAEGFVFYSWSPDKPLGYRSFFLKFREALEEIGISREEQIKRYTSLHSLRHFFNSYLVNSGISTITVQKLIGHSSDSMTARYTHGDETKIIDLQDRLWKIG